MLNRGSVSALRIARVGIVTGAVALLMSGCSGGLSGVTDTASSILGLNTTKQAENGEVVIYTRSPLVLPPDYNLRPPSSEEQQKAQLGANWPKDPDAEARAERAAQRKELAEKAKAEAGRVVFNERVLTPEELARGTVPAGRGGNPADSVLPTGERERPLTPEEMRTGVKSGEENRNKQTSSEPQVPVEQQSSGEQQTAESGGSRGFWSRINPF